MPSRKLVNPSWENGKVYLIQFPRSGCIPSPSPYSMKLETWIRMAGIDYTNINNEFKHMSKRGQQPFIELNGQEFSDSSLIITKLAEEFGGKGKELEDLPPFLKAQEHAFYALIEHHLVWINLVSRSIDFKWIATEQGYGRLFTGVKAFFMKNIVVPQFQKKLKARLQGQWIGTLTNEEKISELKKDLDAISEQLGKQKYLFGDEVKTIDATLFGHLAEVLYTPQFTPQIKEHIETKCSNLITYFNSIKEQYWPDWEDKSMENWGVKK